MICLREANEGILLSVHAQPGASRSAVKGMHGDALKIAVKAPPVDGEANEAIRELLAEIFSVPASRIELKSGASGRRKVFLLRSISFGEAKTVLQGNMK